MAGSDHDGLKLEQAIIDKYCPPVEEAPPEEQKITIRTRGFRETALGYKPGGCAVARRPSIVLDGSGVSCVGSGSGLSSLCPCVQELHLAGNNIEDWKHVCTILSSLSSLTFLDLSRNPLSDTFTVANPVCHTGLTLLVLNSTKISWNALQGCLQMLPSLQEIHLSGNDCSTVQFDSSFSLPCLQKLHMNNNPISKWEELSKLSPAFPNLQTLIMCDGPLGEIPALASPCDLFPELVCLNLNGSSLSQWSSVEHLSGLCKLKELSLMKVPLGKDLDEKERRFAAIARLPNLSKLNKTSVSESEREDAERWFIRQYSDSQHPLLGPLKEKHGEVQPLAVVDMDQVQTKMMIEFLFDGHREFHEIKLRQTTKQLKVWIGQKLVGMPPSTFKIFFHKRAHWNEMTFPAKKLYTYPLKDNDQIFIEMRSRQQ